MTGEIHTEGKYVDDYYRIDQQGEHQRWRVWWIGPLGFTCSLPFDSRQAAERWVEFMDALPTSPPATGPDPDDYRGGST